MTAGQLPRARDEALVGTYPARTAAGGGYVWDAVLEYRVWCHAEGGSDGFRAFATYEDALAFSQGSRGAEAPLALVLQEEHIEEPQAGSYRHVPEPRITEWPVELLRRPRRTADTIPDFLASEAPNRLQVLRGE